MPKKVTVDSYDTIFEAMLEEEEKLENMNISYLD